MKLLYLTYFLSALAISSPVWGESSPTAAIDPTTAQQVLGTGRQSILDCPSLVNRTWAYPNAQITSVCDDAAISCASYGLLQRQKKQVKGQGLQDINTVLGLSRQVAKMKLVACAQALDAITLKGESFLKASGYEEE